MYKTEIEIPVFKVKIGIVFSHKEVAPEDAPFEYAGFDGDYGGLCAFLIKPDGTPFPYKVAIHVKECELRVVAHEAIHAAGYVLGQMGVQPSWEDDEVLAYFVEHIVEHCEERWDEICKSYRAGMDADGVRSNRSNKPPKRRSRSGSRSNDGGQEPSG